MRVWRMSLQRTKSAIISWQELAHFSYEGSIILTLLHWFIFGCMIIHVGARQNQQNNICAQPWCIRAVWSESWLCAQWEANDQGFFMQTAKTYQIRLMPRLIEVFTRRTGHFVSVYHVVAHSCFVAGSSERQIRYVFEPCHEIMEVFVFRKLVFQMRMHSQTVGQDVWFLAGPFIDVHTLCVCKQQRLWWDCADGHILSVFVGIASSRWF